MLHFCKKKIFLIHYDSFFTKYSNCKIKQQNFGVASSAVLASDYDWWPTFIHMVGTCSDRPNYILHSVTAKLAAPKNSRNKMSVAKSKQLKPGVENATAI